MGFNDDVNGILINFNEIFFSSFLANSHYLSEFSFFTANGMHSSVDLSGDDFINKIHSILFKIQEEYASNQEFKLDLIKTMLLQMFFLIARKTRGTQNIAINKNNYIVFRNFEKLIELNFTKMRMPKNYANLLYVTPNHLNSLCNQLTGKSAGDIIRNRVLLEAKRLLVNSNQNINEIAWHLSFEDNSYFSKFFKKYEGITPEEFRKFKQ